jgi:hypothetical protein
MEESVCICGQPQEYHRPGVGGCTRFIDAANHIGIIDKRRGFFQIEYELVDLYLATGKINTYGFSLYCVLARFAKRTTQATFVGQKRMAETMCCSRSTIQRELDRLSELGLLRCTSGKAAGIKNVYELVDPRIAQPSKPVQDKENETDGASPEVHPVTAVDAGGASITGVGCLNDGFHNRKNKKDVTTPSPQLLETAKENEPKVLSAHSQMVAEIDRLYELGNPGVDCPWGGRATSALKRLIASSPRWTTEQWLKCVRHRFASDNIVTGDPPENFIPNLKRYISGPINAFNRDKKGGNDGKSVVERNTAARDQTHSRIDGVATQDDF